MEVAEWVAGPGAALSAQARDDLLAMFASYDRGGLVGDPSPLRRLLGREPGTWAQVLARPLTSSRGAAPQSTSNSSMV